MIDTAITGGDNARGTTVNRIIGGNPPTAAQFNISKQFVDLVEQGQLQSLEEVASAEGWRDFIYPPELIETCEFEGEFYCVPVNIHSAQWMWINNEVFEKAGVSKTKYSSRLYCCCTKNSRSRVYPSCFRWSALARRSYV